MEQWITGIVAVLGALGVREIIPGASRWIAGASDRERHRVQHLISARDAATDRADAEAAKRRILEEYASGLRRHLISAGIPPDDIAPWPTP